MNSGLVCIMFDIGLILLLVYIISGHLYHV